MTRRRSRKPGRQQRTCAACGGGIPDQRPVYLVTDAAGGIIGPFHAGCAERLVLGTKGNTEMPAVPAATNYGTWPSAREESLPW